MSMLEGLLFVMSEALAREASLKIVLPALYGAHAAVLVGLQILTLLRGCRVCPAFYIDRMKRWFKPVGKSHNLGYETYTATNLEGCGRVCPALYMKQFS